MLEWVCDFTVNWRQYLIFYYLFPFTMVLMENVNNIKIGINLENIIKYENMSINKNGSSNKKSTKIIILISHSILTSTWILILRYSRSSDTQYIIPTAVFLSEIIKIIIALSLLLVENRGIFSTVANRLMEDIVFNMRETFKLLIPAVLYVIQNNLLFIALTNLDAPSYQVTYEMKILTTALFSKIMLGRKLSWLQWFSLCLLVIGVSLVQIAIIGPSSTLMKTESSIRGPHIKEIKMTLNETHRKAKVAWFIGVIAVFICCLSSGFSGVYFERILKKAPNFSLHIRNIQLGIFSLIFSFIAVCGQSREILEKGFFYAYTSTTWIVIFLQAFGGFIVSLTMKYADNILKGFATSMSIIMSSLLSWMLLGDNSPSIQFIVGASIVIAATLLYSIASSKTEVPNQQKAKIII